MNKWTVYRKGRFREIGRKKFKYLPLIWPNIEYPNLYIPQEILANRKKLGLFLRQKWDEVCKECPSSLTNIEERNEAFTEMNEIYEIGYDLYSGQFLFDDLTGPKKL